jgi:polyisoprenoid-binding protein YceI
MTTNTAPEVAVSTWSIDLAHSSLRFKVRHMAIAWVRGEFRITRAALNWNPANLKESHVDVEIDPRSVNTGEPQRDEHLRSDAFLDVEHFPSMHYQCANFSRSGDVVILSGELTIRGVTRPVELRVTEISSPTRDPWGNVRLAASATASLNRKEFGLTWNTALETGGFLVGDEIFVDLDLEFMKGAAA